MVRQVEVGPRALGMLPTLAAMGPIRAALVEVVDRPRVRLRMVRMAPARTADRLLQEERMAVMEQMLDSLRLVQKVMPGPGQVVVAGDLNARLIFGAVQCSGGLGPMGKCPSPM